MFSGFVTRGQEARKSSEPYWDGVYAQNRPIFSRRPTELLRYAVKDRPPGKALDIGMGQGRNAIFLAQQRWEVTGFDPSVEGVRQAQETAHQLRLHLNASVAREEDFDLGREKWDLIVITYVRRLNVEDANRLQRALKRSGILVYENNNVGRGSRAEAPLGSERKRETWSSERTIDARRESKGKGQPPVYQSNQSLREPPTIKAIAIRITILRLKSEA